MGFEFGTGRFNFGPNRIQGFNQYKTKFFPLSASIEKFLMDRLAAIKPAAAKPSLPPSAVTVMPPTRLPPMNPGLDCNYQYDFNNMFINLIKDLRPYPLLTLPTGTSTREFFSYAAKVKRLNSDIMIRQIQLIINQFRIRSPYHWPIDYNVWPITDSSYELAWFGAAHDTQKGYIFCDGNDRKYLLFCRMRIAAKEGPINDVEVLDGGEWLSLEEWLIRELPVFKVIHTFATKVPRWPAN